MEQGLDRVDTLQLRVQASQMLVWLLPVVLLEVVEVTVDVWL
jgi:hypothetical protein